MSAKLSVVIPEAAAGGYPGPIHPGEKCDFVEMPRSIG
jgi:hypothetical protein